VRLFLLVFVLNVPNLSLLSQDDSLSEKYWSSRRRLLNKFIFQGIGPGRGYAAAAIAKERAAKVLYYGDNTTYHGWYLSVLATEFALLQRCHSDSSKTLHELYNALFAVHRLDSMAEAYFIDRNGAHGRPAVNGFFIRDDADYETIKNLGWEGRLMSDYELGCNLHPGEKGLRDNEMSQDQAIHLLLGLRLVHHLLDDDIKFQGRILKKWAAEMAIRIIDHIASRRWIIYNPVTNKAVFRGHDARLFSWAFVKTRLKFAPEGPVTKPIWYSSILWPWLRTTLIPIYFNRAMIMTLGTISNAYGSSKTTRRFLCANAKLWKKEIYPLIHEILEPDAGRLCIPESKIKEMLMNADSTAFRSFGSYGWNTTNRWLASAKTYKSYDGFFKEKEVSGLDFMLLHNVYRLLYKSPTVFNRPKNL